MKTLLRILLLLIFSLDASSKYNNAIVYSSFRDSRGLIWLGTATGLAIYQNNKSINYQHSRKDTNSILNGIVYSIAEDDLGNIWAATYTNGITILNPEKNYYHRITPLTHPEVLADRNIITINYDSNKTMIVNTSSGTYAIDTKNYSYKSVLPYEFNGLSVLMSKYENKKMYYLINKKGLLEISQNGRIKLISLPIHEMNFMGLATIDQQLYVSGHTGIYQLLNEQLVKLNIYHNNVEISNEGVNDMLEDKYHNIYINSLKYGMLKAIKIGHRFICSKGEYGDWFKGGNTIYSNYYDSVTHEFFVGTQQGLIILKVNSKYFNELKNNTNDPLTIRSILSFGNQLLIGTENGAYNYHKTLHKISQQSLPKKAFISNLFCTKDNHVFGSGFQFYHLKNDKLYAPKEINNLFSNSDNIVLANVFNDSIIFAVSNATKEIVFWNYLRNSFIKSKVSISDDLTPPALVFNKHILLNTFNGMYLYDPLKKKLAKITNKDDTQITDIKIENKTIFYSSSTEGIIILDSNFKQIKKINVSKFIPSNDVRSIHVFKNIIWFASNDGIGYYDLRYDKLAYFNSGYLFSTTKFLNGSVTRNNELLYFGGENGIVTANTNQILKETKLPKCYLLDVSIYTEGELKKVINPDRHSFDYFENNIEIQMANSITDFSYYTKYDYTLNQNPSIPIEDNNRIKLYNLTPNYYELNVIERESKMVTATYHFTISPPWYQTWWFRTLLGITILANAVWITRLYFKRRILAQQKEIEKQIALQSERDRISIDMHDDLGSGLSSIKLISEMLKRKHSDEETQNDLTQIVENATELTGTMRDMVWSLNPRNDSLDKFILHIQQYTKTFFEPSEINIQIEIPKEIPSNSMSGFIRRNLFLCIKEVFNNIIKHSKANSVLLKCELEPNLFIITIHDNGIGLSENNQPNNGFYSMQKRVQDCNGKIEWHNNEPGLITTIAIPI